MPSKTFTVAPAIAVVPSVLVTVPEIAPVGRLTLMFMLLDVVTAPKLSVAFAVNA